MGSNKMVVSDGTYTVGVDIPAGRYDIIASGPEVEAKYEITTNGEDDDKVTVSPDGATITLTDGQVIIIENAIMMESGSMNPQTYDDGTYLVGTDITTGNYMIVSNEEGGTSTYIVSSDKEGNDVVTSGDITTTMEAEIVLKDGQYITLVNSSMVNMDDTVFINY